MPYIEQDKRRLLEPIIRRMAHKEVKADGDLNYILYTFCKRYIKPSYNNYKNFCGELRQCATEIERRLLAEHEERKIKENGDIK